VSAADTAVLERRALRLEYLTISWNLIEAVIAVGSGIVAGSIALIGFGFDSSIEAFAASVVIWQLRGSASEERERRALRIFAVTFFVLAAYVIIDSIRDLIVGEQAGESTVGITLAIISSSCRRSPGSSAAPDRRWEAPFWWLTLRRPISVRGYPPSCSSDLSSTPQWAGGGQTP
jgi:hypothetical protein